MSFSQNKFYQSKSAFGVELKAKANEIVQANKRMAQNNNNVDIVLKLQLLRDDLTKSKALIEKQIPAVQSNAVSIKKLSALAEGRALQELIDEHDELINSINNLLRDYKFNPASLAGEYARIEDNVKNLINNKMQNHLIVLDENAGFAGKVKEFSASMFGTKPSTRTVLEEAVTIVSQRSGIGLQK